MFEAIHGSAPDIAAQDIANPSALLNGAVMMLKHIGQPEVAARIQNAWLKTIEDGIHTGDIYSEAHSSKKVGTREFTDALIERLGQEPGHLQKAVVKEIDGVFEMPPLSFHKSEKTLCGTDLFIDWDDHQRNPDTLGTALEKVTPATWKLKMITNRGVKVYPDGFPETFCTDHWRCRFVAAEGKALSNKDIIELLSAVESEGL